LVEQIFLFVRSNLFSYFSLWKGEFQFCFTDQATISQSKDFFVFVVSRVAFKKRQNYFPIDGTHRSALIYKSLFNNFFFDFYWIAHWFKSGYPTVKATCIINENLRNNWSFTLDILNWKKNISLPVQSQNNNKRMLKKFKAE
jgi:hypothetical protein